MAGRRDPHEHHKQRHKKHLHISRIAFAILSIILILQSLRAHNYAGVAVFGGFLIAVLALEIWLLFSDKPE